MTKFSFEGLLRKNGQQPLLSHEEPHFWCDKQPARIAMRKKNAMEKSTAKPYRSGN